MKLTRRHFLKAGTLASGTLVIGLSLPGCASRRADPVTQSGDWPMNAWLEIAADSRVIFTLDRVEMGQGTYTGLTTLVAEELDLEPALIEVRFAPADQRYRNPLYQLQITGGSTSLSSSWQQLRQAGADARYLLTAAAARTWETDRSSLTIGDRAVLHPDGRRRLSFGELIALAAVEELPEQVPLKLPAEFRFIGKQNQRLDSVAKTTGTAEYGIDVERPGMVYAVLIRPPMIGGRVGAFDADRARTMRGVIDIFAIDRGVAVVADSYWRAVRARENVSVTWDTDSAVRASTPEIFAQYRQAADSDPGVTEREGGDIEPALTRGRILEVEYQQPYLAHATLEPQNCTAEITDRGLEIWAPTQGPDVAQVAAARGSGFSLSDIYVHTTFIGGGFGRRLSQDYVEEAAAIVVRVKRPVKLIWSREDDTRHDVYRPATLHRLRASIEEGQVSAWDHQIIGPEILPWYARNSAAALYPWVPQFMYDTLARTGPMLEGIATPKDYSAIEGAVDLPYKFGHLRVRHTHVDPGIPISYWRSVGHSHNGFATETFMDELAHELGEDPLVFRRRLLTSEPRHRAVLETAAKAAGWGSKPASGRARGLALHRSFGTYVAQVVEAGIVQGGIKVYRVTCAVDCGTVVNPDIVRSQIESGVIFGLTAALYGNIEFENGQVRQSNFHDYRLLQMQETPEIEVVLVESGEDATGVGEPGLPPVIPALGNALFALTGKRQRTLPLSAGV